MRAAGEPKAYTKTSIRDRSDCPEDISAPGVPSLTHTFPKAEHTLGILANTY